MRSLSYLNLGEEFPVAPTPGNAAVLEEESQGFTGIYQAVVRGVLLSALAAQALTAQATISGGQAEELPQSAAAQQLEDESYLLAPRPLAWRVAQPLIDVDEFVPVAAATGIAFDDDAAPVTRTQLFAAIVRPTLPEDELPAGAAPSISFDDSDAPPWPARLATQRLAVFLPDEEYPQLAAPPTAIDESGVTIQTTRYAARATAPFSSDDDFVPQQPRVVTDDSDAAIPSIAQTRIAVAFFTPEEFPQLSAVALTRAIALSSGNDSVSSASSDSKSVALVPSQSAILSLNSSE